MEGTIEELPVLMGIAETLENQHKCIICLAVKYEFDTVVHSDRGDFHTPGTEEVEIIDEEWKVWIDSMYNFEPKDAEAIFTHFAELLDEHEKQIEKEVWDKLTTLVNDVDVVELKQAG